MPPSKPTRTLDKGRRRSRKQYKRESRRNVPPPVMLEPEVENVSDSEDYPGGGLMIRNKDTEGILHDETFFPNDHVAFNNKWLSAAARDLCGDSYADSMDYESLIKDTKGCPVVFVSSLVTQCGMYELRTSQNPPNPRDKHLYRTFEFSPSLWIRVWDPSIPILTGDTLEVFGVDIVDVCGRPQAVNTRVKVIAGVRPALSPEKKGDITKAFDDIGVRMDRFDRTPSRYPISADSEYIFEDGWHRVTYTFHHNLLTEPAPERLPHWMRPKTELSRSRSAD
ncbi:uncharacterized protein ARMOST_02652 [Armillaria ostoyae]|uniref:Uncharacterized protein n=1 Tax=Armillaria ostoyae TaxID=47428 RepID=A0A284QSD0_ARMOS|nr:uncharacterized protein ARMOST_02652 [Armillaria ostoyae]